MFAKLRRLFRRQATPARGSAEWANMLTRESLARLFPGEVISQLQAEVTLTISQNGRHIWSQQVGPSGFTVEATVGDAEHAKIVGTAIARAAHQMECNFGDLLGREIAAWATLSPDKPFFAPFDSPSEDGRIVEKHSYRLKNCASR